MMKNQTIRRVFLFSGTALMAMSLTGCKHIDPLMCGYGTIETLIGGERHCVVAPVSCGAGTQEAEQATGVERECEKKPDADFLKCGDNTYELEQATGVERERQCMPGTSPCPAGKIAYADANGVAQCRDNYVCGEGTYEQATGGERECVPEGSVSGCGPGTEEKEQATGVERECETLPPGS
jgi:hypothetical protein